MKKIIFIYLVLTYLLLSCSAYDPASSSYPDYYRNYDTQYMMIYSPFDYGNPYYYERWNNNRVYLRTSHNTPYGVTFQSTSNRYKKRTTFSTTRRNNKGVNNNTSNNRKTTPRNNTRTPQKIKKQ